MKQTIFSIIILWIMTTKGFALTPEPVSPSIETQMKQAIVQLGNEPSKRLQVSSVFSEPDASPKSAKKALMLSLLVPGLGEYYIGAKRSSQIFLGTELLTWSGYAGFELLGSWRREDLNSFALQHAGVNIEGRDNKFLQILKRYPRSENLPNLSGSYNEIVRRDARYFYPHPDSTSARDNYFSENALTGDDAFTWDTRNNWNQYKILLHDYRQAGQYAFYMTGMAVMNRLVSALNAAWLAKKLNKNIDQNKVSIVFNPDVIKKKATLTLKVKY